MNPPQLFYRCESHNVFDLGVKVNISAFRFLKETRSGYWIKDYGKNRWVSKTARKRYAYPTKEEAITSFKARKERQIELLEYQLENARHALNTPVELYEDQTH